MCEREREGKRESAHKRERQECRFTEHLLCALTSLYAEGPVFFFHPDEESEAGKHQAAPLSPHSWPAQSQGWTPHDSRVLWSPLCCPTSRKKGKDGRTEAEAGEAKLSKRGRWQIFEVLGATWPQSQLLNATVIKQEPQVHINEGVQDCVPVKLRL